MENFHHGGKRAKIAWFRKWWGSGDAIIIFVRWAGTVVFGAQGIIMNDLTNLIMFLLIYVPSVFYIGCAYYWYDQFGAEAYTTQLLDPFSYQVKRRLKIRDGNGY